MGNREESLRAEFTFESGGTPVGDDEVFRILFIGDWSGGSPAGAVASRKPVFIDRDEFDDVMRTIPPSVEIPIGSGEGGTILIEFRSLDDFHPDNLLENVGLFNDLRDLRRRLLHENSFPSAAAEVRSMLGTPTSTGAPAAAQSSGEGGGLLDDILGSAESRNGLQSGDPLKELISNLVSPHLVRIDEAEQSQMVAAVDAAISDLMSRILHNPDFQEMESAWRGLFFVVRRADTGTDLKLHILNISKDEFFEDLKSKDELTETFFFKSLSPPDADRFAMVCGNFQFSVDVDDVAALIRAGNICSALQTPFVSHIDGESVASFSDDGGLIEGAGFFDDGRSEKLWQALRSQECAASIGLLTPKFLGRLPYGKDSETTERFSFEEFPLLTHHEKYLWINPAFLLALNFCRAFSNSGWDLRQSLEHDVTGLPVHFHSVDGVTVAKPCGEFLMTESACQQLIEMGLMPVVTFRDSDRIKMPSFLSVSSGGDRLNGRWS